MYRLHKTAAGCTYFLADSVAKRVRPLVIRVMVQELESDAEAYMDCGEVNTTKLAEQVADDLDLYGKTPEDPYTIPDDVFDWAVDAAERFEKAQQKGGG